MADRAIIICAADLGESGHCELPVDHDGMCAGAPPEAEQKLQDLMGRVADAAREATEPADVALTPSQAFTAAVTVLRRHAAVCRRPVADRLAAVADLIEGAVEPDQDPAEVDSLRRERDSLARRCAVRFEENEAALSVIRHYDAQRLPDFAAGLWRHRADLRDSQPITSAEMSALRRALDDDAGVAAGPQATPDQVLWEGDTQPFHGGERKRVSFVYTPELSLKPGTRVRVVAVPTDHEDPT